MLSYTSRFGGIVVKSYFRLELAEGVGEQYCAPVKRTIERRGHVSMPMSHAVTTSS